MPNPTYEWTVPTTNGSVTVVAETEQVLCHVASYLLTVRTAPAAGMNLEVPVRPRPVGLDEEH